MRIRRWPLPCGRPRCPSKQSGHSAKCRREGVDLGHQEALDHQDGELRVPEEAGGQHAQEAGGGH